jgi:alpha-beta hydrolase superfamily lysophospholipase
MLEHIKIKAQACPNTKFVMKGHSQGGFVTVRTIVRMDKELKGKIMAVTMFGSPPCAPLLGLGNRCKSYCYARDEVNFPVLVIQAFRERETRRALTIAPILTGL